MKTGEFLFLLFEDVPILISDIFYDWRRQTERRTGRELAAGPSERARGTPQLLPSAPCASSRSPAAPPHVRVRRVPERPWPGSRASAGLDYSRLDAELRLGFEEPYRGEVGRRQQKEVKWEEIRPHGGRRRWPVRGRRRRLGRAPQRRELRASAGERLAGPGEAPPRAQHRPPRAPPAPPGLAAGPCPAGGAPAPALAASSSAAAPFPHGDSALNEQEKELQRRLKRLYPAVDEQETPLPRSWSPKDKFSYIGLSQNNLRVHYKGHGKTPKDAASVRATHPIPAACGIYYFEVKIVSKGRDGYMGIGLSAQGVNMNRLPGWDKHSYGYHGDDGHSFCSSGTGQPYGPTFTTGDVIGCCVNLINNTCFYTKNGHSLGIAFTDLPPNLYPTVGLQTPGEVVDANFGQHPFVFDIEDYMREWRTKIQAQIDRFPIGDREGEWQTMIQKMVSSYLVHHGYCATAEAFARSTDQTVLEELASIKNRQRIQKLVLAGRMGEAIETTQQLYPSLLERNPNLLFTLKVRQFIEMVNGTDSEVRCLGGRSPKSQDSYPVSPRPFSSPSMSPSHGMNIHNLAPGKGSTAHYSGFESCSNGVISNKAHQSYCHSKHQSSNLNVPELNSINMSRSQQVNNFTSNDVDMETDHYSNGVGETSSNGFLNGSSKHDHEMEDCDTEMGLQLDAFSLLAYSDPWNSPVGNQLDPIQREPVCSALNSAILETHNLPKQPPLALAMGQATQCLGLMARSGIGSCAFATVEDYLH
ncbi:PREDICTED: ran-binding protein 9 [Propithecus coquereli]|nr:PREDICTED: ran-binding protein 9 [Propithecus coquereli]